MVSTSHRTSEGCWVWERTITDYGYGRMTYQGRLVHVHRQGYELLMGPIPAGLVPDHLCENKACWNPGHLELVTVGENLLRSSNTKAAQNVRKTHCPRGHEYSGTNVRNYSQQTSASGRRGPSRTCRTCAVLGKRARKRGMTLDQYIDRYGDELVIMKNQFG